MSRPKTSGSFQTKQGKKAYRGKRKHWYVYFYDDDGKFKKKMIGQVQVPYYGSLIRRRKSYFCPACGTDFRSMRDRCPKCGKMAHRVKKGPGTAKARTSPYTSQQASPAESEGTPDII